MRTQNLSIYAYFSDMCRREVEAYRRVAQSVSSVLSLPYESMKKYWSKEPYKRYNRRRALKSLEARLRHKDSKRYDYSQRRAAASGKVRIARGGFNPIHAPDDFSLVRNPDGVVRFIEVLRRNFEERRRVWVALTEVKHIDYDAIVVLLSAMVRFKSKGISFNGDFPKDGHNRKILQQSGFFKNLYSRSFSDSDEFVIESEEKDFISTHGQKVVDSELTENIILAAAKTIWGVPRRCLGVQTVLVELMQNTFNWAVPTKEGARHWWLSVNHEEGEKKVRFAFVDYGVGIFTSLETKPKGAKFYGVLKRLADRIKYGNNAELLRLILHGELHKTASGEYNRGQGIPALLESLEDNSLSNLHIISNNVYASVAQNEYRIMKSFFNGTFVYWEVNANNSSLEQEATP